MVLFNSILHYLIHGCTRVSVIVTIGNIQLNQHTLEFRILCFGSLFFRSLFFSFHSLFYHFTLEFVLNVHRVFLLLLVSLSLYYSLVKDSSFSFYILSSNLTAIRYKSKYHLTHTFSFFLFNALYTTEMK